jgi:hypothetical protein
MRRKIFIACFFAIMLLLVPCVSAFKVELSRDDKRELLNLIKNETMSIQEVLESIFYEENQLDLDEIEAILESGNLAILQTDSWDWIIDRLGWVYETMEYVINIYNTGMAIYYEFLEGLSLASGWIESIQYLRQAWQAFKANPINFETIINLITAVIDLIYATISLIEYIVTFDIAAALEDFTQSVTEFRSYLEGNPWLLPITIHGTVTGISESVTISCKSDSETTTSSYEISYSTSDTSLPWFVHYVSIDAEYQGKTITKKRFAFSKGSIEQDFDEADFTVKSKSIDTAFPKINLLFQRLSILSNFLNKFSFFQKINCKNI